jgi:hypothetical protein
VSSMAALQMLSMRGLRKYNVQGPLQTLQTGILNVLGGRSARMRDEVDTIDDARDEHYTVLRLCMLGTLFTFTRCFRNSFVESLRDHILCVELCTQDNHLLGFHAHSFDRPHTTGSMRCLHKQLAGGPARPGVIGYRAVATDTEASNIRKSKCMASLVYVFASRLYSKLRSS